MRVRLSAAGVRLSALGVALVLGLALVLDLALAGSAWAQPTPVMQAPVTIAGPSAAIQGLSGLSVSRDGTGGLVYLESVGGVNHVFLSALSGGVFGAPQEIDAGLGGASSQPVVAAGDGGLLLIAFINGGELYVVSRANQSSPLSAPQGLAGGALNPSIALSIHSEGYLAFTASDGSGWDVRNFYYSDGSWQLDPTTLNASPADDAGTGAGAPTVTAAGDGEGIVAWGENGHIYARRVWFAMASPEVEQADPPSLAGMPEISADSPRIGTSDISSYTDISFREIFQNGTSPVSRVLMNPLVASAFQGSMPLTAAAADDPGIAMMQYGNGFVTTELEGSNQVWADILGQNGAPGPLQQIDSLPNASAPYPTAAIAGDYTGLIAWQHDPGSSGAPEIRARYYTNSAFGPEMVASDPSLGPTDAAQGLLAAGDHGGDVAIAYVQGTGDSTTIDVAQLIYPPGSFGVHTSPRYRSSLTPKLTWSAPRELWGPITYQVSLDGAAVGSTPGTAFTPKAALPQGPHTLTVTATNAHGLTSTAGPARFFVDTLPPVGAFVLSGRDRVGSVVSLRARYADVRTGVPAADVSGVASVYVAWGDGMRQAIPITTATALGATAAHAYLRAGSYAVTVTITDRAGNRTVLQRKLQIRASAKKKP